MSDADDPIQPNDTPDDPARTCPHRPPHEVRERGRQDDLDGLSAPVCCRRHGVGLTALRKRAITEGWRRADRPWTPPEDLRAPDDAGHPARRG